MRVQRGTSFSQLTRLGFVCLNGDVFFYFKSGGCGFDLISIFSSLHLLLVWFACLALRIPPTCDFYLLGIHIWLVKYFFLSLGSSWLGFWMGAARQAAVANGKRIDYDEMTGRQRMCRWQAGERLADWGWAWRSWSHHIWRIPHMLCLSESDGKHRALERGLIWVELDQGNRTWSVICVLLHFLVYQRDRPT